MDLHQFRTRRPQVAPRRGRGRAGTRTRNNPVSDKDREEKRANRLGRDALRAHVGWAWLPQARPRPSSAWRSRDGRARPRRLRARKRRRKDCEVAAAVAERWAPVGTGEERGAWAAGLSWGTTASVAARRRSESAAGGGGSRAGRTGTPLASEARTGARREAELAQPGL